MGNMERESAGQQDAAVYFGLSNRGVVVCGATYGWHLFGFTALMLWSSFFLGVLGSLGAAHIGAFYVSEGLFLLACAAFQLLTGRRLRGAFRRWLPAAAAVMLASPLALSACAGAFGAGSAAAYVPAAVGSLCWALLVYVAADALKPLDAGGNAAVVALSFAAVPAIRLPLNLVGGPAMGVASSAAVALFVLLSLGAGPAGALAGESPSDGGAPRETTAGLAFLVVLICAFGFCMGLLRLGFAGAEGSAAHLVLALSLQALFPVGLLFLSLRKPHKMSLGVLCQTSLVFVLLAFAALFAFKGDAAMASALSGVTRYSLYVVLCFALSAMAGRLGMSHSTVFCAGWGLYAVSSAAGIAAARLSGGLSGMADWPAMAVMGILTCVTFLSFNVGDATDVKFFGDGRPAAAGGAAPAGDLEGRCARIADERGLARRELEVMVLICKGRSRPYIAEELVLSENTVRTYAKALYSKLGVHSRQELLTLVESASPE